MLRVHFLNVGHGDCTIIRHPSGRLTMVDVNNSQCYDEESKADLIEEVLRKSYSSQAGISSIYPSMRPKTPGFLEYSAASIQVEKSAKEELTDPIEFMQCTYPGQKLWRFILTHPDLDHMRGLKRVYDAIGFDNFWDTMNLKVIENFRSEEDKVDWQFYQQLRQTSLCKTYTQGTSAFAFGRDLNGFSGGDNIEILSPNPAIIRDCNMNNSFNDISIVFRIYHAGISILLPGDAGDLSWQSLVSEYGSRLKSDFLKASHHGRDSGYCVEAIKLIRPLMTFVSVGQKPATDATSKYRNFSGQVASTRFYGDIELVIYDNGYYEWSVRRNHGR